MLEVAIEDAYSMLRGDCEPWLGSILFLSLLAAAGCALLLRSACAAGREWEGDGAA
ncbi:hypothetical protein GCM10007338_08690 [Corynebacterium pelargi]|nr:hypothetical protein GCM10007338_08690 [Corynebacterium pelargi]